MCWVFQLTNKILDLMVDAVNAGCDDGWVMFLNSDADDVTRLFCNQAFAKCGEIEMQMKTMVVSIYH